VTYVLTVKRENEVVQEQQKAFICLGIGLLNCIFLSAAR
jgi:hypothetical protein